MATTSNGSVKDLTSGLDDGRRPRPSPEREADRDRQEVQRPRHSMPTRRRVGSLVDFQQKAAGATQLDWVNTVVKAQTDFVTEISARLHQRRARGAEVVSRS